MCAHACQGDACGGPSANDPGVRPSLAGVIGPPYAQLSVGAHGCNDRVMLRRHFPSLAGHAAACAQCRL